MILQNKVFHNKENKLKEKNAEDIKIIDEKITDGYYDIMPSVYAAKMKQRHNKMIEEGKIKIKEEPVHKKTEEEVDTQGWLPPRSVVQTQFPFEDKLTEEPGAKEAQDKLDKVENLKTYYDK